MVKSKDLSPELNTKSNINSSDNIVLGQRKSRSKDDSHKLKKSHKNHRHHHHHHHHRHKDSKKDEKLNKSEKQEETKE